MPWFIKHCSISAGDLNTGCCCVPSSQGWFKESPRRVPEAMHCDKQTNLPSTSAARTTATRALVIPRASDVEIQPPGPQYGSTTLPAGGHGRSLGWFASRVAASRPRRSCSRGWILLAGERPEAWQAPSPQTPEALIPMSGSASVATTMNGLPRSGTQISGCRQLRFHICRPGQPRIRKLADSETGKT